MACSAPFGQVVLSVFIVYLLRSSLKYKTCLLVALLYNIEYLIWLECQFTLLFMKVQAIQIIGELREDLLVEYFATDRNFTATQNFFVSSGGIYLLPEAVPSDGRLLSVRAYGYFGYYEYSSELELGPSLPKVSKPDGANFLFVVLYRPSMDGRTYTLAHEPTELRHRFTPGRIPGNRNESLDWEVCEGDLIGVFIPEVCVYNFNKSYSCVSQVNLETDDCRSALYHPAVEDIDNLPREEFEEISIWLNVEAVLSERNTGQGAGIIVAPIIAAVILGIGVTVVILVLIVIRSLKVGKGKVTSHFSQPNESAHHINSLATQGQPHTDCSSQAHIAVNAKKLAQLNLVIPACQLKLLDVIGKGEFGVVYKGHLTGWQGETAPKVVAVKTLKKISANGINSLIKESEKMMKFEHGHVLSVTGVCIDEGEAPYIIMPHMANGSLLQYLRSVRPQLTFAHGAREKKITDATRKLLSICLQIAKGMCYLAEMKFVHRDLAARNCMISEDFVIKVADFGLAEDIYCCDYFRQGQGSEEAVKLPVKWMALESLLDSIFTEKTDVWSYGVTCWEVFSLGHTPYPTVNPHYLVKYLGDGGRLEKPSNAACTEQVYSFICQCWRELPEDRSTFQEITEAVDCLLESVAGYLDFTAFYSK